MSDSDDNEGYTKNSWFNDAYNQDDPIPGIDSYRKYFRFKTDHREPKYLRDGHLGLVYPAILFIAGRVLSRVWDPSQGPRHIIDSISEVSGETTSQEINTIRIATVVKHVETLIERDSKPIEFSENRKITSTYNIGVVDQAFLDLYAESAICIKLAGQYYPDDDEKDWKPMFDRYMTALWDAHLFIQTNYTQKEQVADVESISESDSD